MAQTVFTNEMTVHVWAQMTQPYGRNSNETLSFNGGELVSYNTAIALHYGAFVLQSSDTFSPTTASKHMTHIWRSATVPVIVVSGLFEWGKRFHGRRDYPTGPAIKKLILADILTLSKSYGKRRTDSTRASDSQQIRAKITSLRCICVQFKLAYPAGYTTAEEVLQTTDKVVKRLADAAKRADQKRKREAAAERAEDQTQMDAWLAGEDVRIPYSHARYDAPAQLTVRGDTVHTSQGAQAPLEHVKLAFRLYRRVLSAGVSWVKNGERCRLGHFDLDRIDIKGNAAAGCHKFTAAELARFAARWEV